MNTTKAYELAKEIYAAIGVDTDKAIERLKTIPVSMHCWQGDDVRGFENPDGDLTGGIQTTGNYPGRATTIDQLRADFEKATSLIPGKKKISLHAIYLDNQGEKVDRDKIEPKHFASWVEWAKEKGIGLDFNPTCFSHPLSASGFTLSSADDGVRAFWIEHASSRESSPNTSVVSSATSPARTTGFRTASRTFRSTVTHGASVSSTPTTRSSPVRTRSTT